MPVAGGPPLGGYPIFRVQDNGSARPGGGVDNGDGGRVAGGEAESGAGAGGSNTARLYRYQGHHNSQELVGAEYDEYQWVVSPETSSLQQPASAAANSRSHHNPGTSPSHQTYAQAYRPAFQPTRPQIERTGTRSVVLANLPEGTSHADIIRAVRGGQLLDVILRSADRTATLAFVYPSDAKAFIQHIKRNDLYIKTKRVGFHLSQTHTAPAAIITRSICFIEPSPAV